MTKNASFSMQIKQEICQQHLNKNDHLYLLLPFLLNNELDINNWSIDLVINVYFDFVAQKVLELSQAIFGKKFVLIKKIPNKNQLVISRKQKKAWSKIENILQTKQYLAKSHLSAFLAGVFLTCGSLNNLDSPNYHLEIRCKNEIFFRATLSCFNACALEIKTTTRRKKLIIYLKKAEMICDFLKIIKVSACALEFENQRIQRGFNNQIQKLNNFDVINLSRTIKTNSQQIHLIKELIERGQLRNYSQSFQDFCVLRLKHPTVSLAQLSYLYWHKCGKKISRSGLSYFVNKLKKVTDG